MRSLVIFSIIVEMAASCGPSRDISKFRVRYDHAKEIQRVVSKDSSGKMIIWEKWQKSTQVIIDTGGNRLLNEL